MSKATKVGELTVEVKTSLSLDDRTLRTCIDLIAIHAKNNGWRGLIIDVPDDDKCDCRVLPIYTEDGLCCALDGLALADNKKEEK